jgi:microcystin-dependent protein
MSTITPINETDPVENAPAVLNTNFDNLNTDKLETVSNVGSGAGTLVQAKSGNNVPIKTISAGSNITITNNANDVNISASAPNPDASSTTKGITKLSVDPVSAPIALGINDPILTGQSGSAIDGSTNKVWDTLATIFPPAMITPYGGSSAPTGWLLCDGSAVSRTTYAALFAVLSTTFGSGDGTTTFNLPDLRGRGLIGVGTGTGGGANGNGAPTGGSALTTRALGDWLGEETHTLSSGEMPSHTHVVQTYASGSGGSNTIGRGGSNGTPEVDQNTNSAGSGSAHNNIQPVMTVNFIIKT